MKLFRRFVELFGKRAGGVQSGGETADVDFKKLEESINYKIKDRQLFAEALSHRSYSQNNASATPTSYERLEFLGDSILNLVVAEYLFHQHTTAPEGDLTKIRSRLVNRKSLNIYALQIHLDRFILMSANVSRLGPRGMEKILADAFEALIAAIYLDGGFSQARVFIEREMHSAIREGSVRMEDENFKSRLLEYAQGEGKGIPRYVTIQEEGPDHDRTFTIEVYLGTEPYGVGMGKNKKDAEQSAAEKALEQLHVLD
jgi:ribonuclease-3